MVWRGQAPVDAAHIGPQRIVVSLESSDGWRSLPRIYRDLPRGRFARAVDEEALVTPGAAAVDVELELARLCSFSHTPEPSLTLEEYAAIAAELSLADDRKWRRDVLASKRLSEDDWSLEEQGWLLRMADATKQGDMSIGERYGRLLQQARAKQTSGGGA
jgi:hypothetical protein